MNNEKDYQRARNKQNFLEMIQRTGEKISDRLSDVLPNPERDFHKGQEVMFTNEYGVTFGAFEILGFSENPQQFYGRCVYLDKDSYWFPVRPSELTLVSEQ